MGNNDNYEWCSEEAKGGDKEFLGWIYCRLIKKDDMFLSTHMKRLEDMIADAKGTIPDGPPITIDITDNKPVTILRHGKLIYKE